MRGGYRQAVTAVCAALLIGAGLASCSSSTVNAEAGGDDAAAHEVIEVLGSGSLPELDAAELEDILRDAHSRGIDPAPEIEYSQGMRPFAELVGELNSRFADSYVGAAWEPGRQSGARAWIAVNKTPSGSLIGAIENSNVPVDVLVTDLPTERDRIAATQIVHLLAQDVLATDDVATGSNPLTGVITVTANASRVTKAIASATAATTRIGQAASRQIDDGLRVHVDFVNHSLLLNPESD